MKKIATVTSGCVVLAGGLFYGYLLSQRPTLESPSTESLPTERALVPQGLVTRNEGNQGASSSKPASPLKPAQTTSAPKNATGPVQSQVATGIKLAPDVRLPAAAMPLDFKVSSVAQKALGQIVEDFYRDLASPPACQNESGNSADSTAEGSEESETGELTRIITNGPEVDAARKRADYRFKALFGNKAYNRMSMNTLLESRTPVSSQK